MSISACMIVKNEEELLGQCLESIKDCADEIVLVDTGSTDKTLEIAEKFASNGYKGDMIFEHFEWIDDFSAARNYSISKATKDWILIIDADEKLDVHDAKALKDIVNDCEHNIIAIDVFNVYGENEIHSRHPGLRLFRRSSKPEYTGKVHNKPVLQKTENDEPPTIYKVPCRLYHYGYGLSEERMNTKYERWMRMCERWVEESPDEAYAWYQYGKSAMARHNKFNYEYVDVVLLAFEKAISIPYETENQKNIHLQSLYNLAKAHYNLKNYEEVVKYCNMALEIKPDYIDALFFAGMACTYHISAGKGERYLKNYLEALDNYKFEEKFETILMETISEKNVVYGALADIEQLKKELVKI